VAYLISNKKLNEEKNNLDQNVNNPNDNCHGGSDVEVEKQ